ncbi:MAG: TonB-dependent receptor [Bacteroidetes bacterium]|nr:TonB-dependent receptor [Bacteroidota bacterium]
MKSHFLIFSNWKLFILISFLLICGTIHSQDFHGNFKLTGTVVDSAAGSELVGVNILISSRADSLLITGTTTDEHGYFSAENISENNVRLKFSMMGYQSKIIDSVSLESVSKIGLIKLRATDILLPEVVVKSIKPMVEIHIDKHIVNIDQVPGNTGSLTEALNNSGEVQIDQATNEITVRGDAVKIQMDGHDFNMPNDLLAQMPASIFEQVEVILSPSAKESAEGGVYIINLISKKTILDNLNASISFNTSTNNRNYGGINFNYKKNKLNIFSALFGYSGNYKWIRNYEQLNYNSVNLYHQLSSGEGNSNGKNVYLKLGCDYDIDENNLLTLYGTYSEYKSDYNSQNIQYVTDKFDMPLYSYNNNSNGLYKFRNTSVYLFYKKKFKNKGNELTLDALYYDQGNPSNSEQYINYSNRLPQIHKDKIGENSNTLILKLEYKHPSEIGDFETGYNFTYRNRENELSALDFLNNSDSWFDSMNLSNYFKYKEDIHAYYITYSKNFGKIGIKTGMRLENLHTNGDQLTTNENFSKNYFNLFPNFNLSYKLNNTFQVVLNIFRRVSYPRLYYVNPFKRYNGPNNYSMGNPELEPYFLNSYGINLSQFIDAYYVYSNGLYSSINSVIDDSVSVSKYINLNTNKTYGIEFTLPYYNSPDMLVKLPDFISTLRIQYSYNYRIQTGQYLNENLNYSSNYQWLNASMGLKLWFDINANISFRYNPKIENVRFKRGEESYLSLYLSKSFFENKLRVNISVRDLLNSQRYLSETFGTDFYSKSLSETYRSRSVSIGISYIFNDYKERRDRNIDDGRDAGENTNL